VSKRLSFAILTLAFANSGAADEELDAAFAKDVLIIEASQCMLFVYDRSQRVSMWMRNTYIPLDMVFARRDGTVSSIAQHTEPMSLRSVISIEAVDFVLELNAGTAERLFIDEDSRLWWEPANDNDE
jgi:uncharacterized membrane protein (UPF0127 family)